MSDFAERFALFRNRRLYIMPTRYGYSFAVLLLIMLLGAMNYSNSLGHLLTFLLFSLAQISMLHCYRNLNGIEIKAITAQPTFCGQTAAVQLNMENNKDQEVYQLDVAYRPHPVSGWNPFKRLRGYQPLGQIKHIPANSQHSEQLALLSHQRGWMHVEQLRIASRYPLGLFESWCYQTQSCQILVYPEPADDLALPFKRQSDATQHESTVQGQDDFAGLQRYRDGEPLHAIAWKALAKENVMRTKQFSKQVGQQLVLDWQDMPTEFTTEQRLSQLCQWVVSAEQQGLIYALSLPNQHIDAGQGEAHRHHCLKALALYD